jgi:hypothetical protein
MSDQTVETVARVEIFEPPMCCPTGLCGPVQDQTLLDLLETVRSLESSGVKVSRYQPSTNPTAFTNHAEVMAAVRARNTAALPITLVNGRVVKSGAYASLEDIREALSVVAP